MPIKTSNLVCPSSSASFVSERRCSLNSSSTISFSRRACVPAARRTVDASNIVIRANPSATAKTGVPKPIFMPTMVASPDTSAEWALGIPPVLMR